jgi:lipopolysaccharide export LptBFGC system permease protein LptF
MRETFEEAGAFTKVLLAAVIVVVVLTAVGYGLDAAFLPWYTGLQRNVVEQSKSFTDSSNLAMTNAIQQYDAINVSITQTQDQAEIAAYKAQQQALKNDICKTRATMKPETVSADVNSWLASHGGCL